MAEGRSWYEDLVQLIDSIDCVVTSCVHMLNWKSIGLNHRFLIVLGWHSNLPISGLITENLEPHACYRSVNFDASRTGTVPESMHSLRVQFLIRTRVKDIKFFKVLTDKYPLKQLRFSRFGRVHTLSSLGIEYMVLLMQITCMWYLPHHWVEP